jgi:hypothetical protein
VSTYFSNPWRSREIWQALKTDHRWAHSNRPRGQRFLGSIRLSQNDANALLNIVRDSFANIRPFTFRKLQERADLYDSQEYWIRLTTLALSEYSYYDTGDTAFWPGVCARLNLPDTSGTQNVLRDVLDRGFELLGLVVDENKHRTGYYSTLCLQSGIPQQNLDHFAQLTQKILREYDWWEITHAEPYDLSQIMYEFCSKYYPGWGKLKKFLKSSCAENNDFVEPISGQLLQGIAIVALELERRGQSPKRISLKVTVCPAISFCVVGKI